MTFAVECAVINCTRAGEIVLTEASSEVGLVASHLPDQSNYGGEQALTAGLAVGDFNGDNWPDVIFLGRGGALDALFINNGDGTFTDMTSVSGTGLDDNGMGQAIADFNNDGRLDWYVTSIFYDNPPPTYTRGNMPYMATDAHAFVEQADAADCRNGGWGWGVKAADLDQDGWVDLIEVNGMPYDVQFNNESGFTWKIDGDGTFTDVTVAAGFGEPMLGRGIATLDADRDGDLDVLVSEYDGPLRYYRNDSVKTGRWLNCGPDTTGEETLPPNGFGTTVKVRIGKVWMQRVINGEPSYLATSELAAHFGLGSADLCDELLVLWPDGRTSQWTSVPADQFLVLQPTSLVPQCPGDLDGNGTVNLLDLLAFLDQWGSPSVGHADLDGSGVVDASDLQALVTRWGDCQ